MHFMNSPSDRLLSDATKKYIEEIFPGLPKKTTEKIEKTFLDKFTGNSSYAFESQYLAHFVRLLESFLKKKADNKLFRIVIKHKGLESKDQGKAMHVPRRSFIVYVDPALSTEKQRVIVAHELGHLLVCEFRERRRTENSPERVATLFGILAVLEKSRFYKARAKEFIYSTEEDVNRLIDVFRSVVENFKDP